MTDTTDSFGHLLQTFRKRVGKTQKALADAVSIPQPTLSAWERGVWRPRFENYETEIGDIAEALGLGTDGVEADMLRRAYREPGEDSRRASAMTGKVGAANREAQSTYGEGKYDIWLVGATRLPILDSEEIADLWVSNLLSGVNYRIIWFVDYIDRAEYHKIESALKRVEQRLEAARAELGAPGERTMRDEGRIHHVPLLFDHDEDHPDVAQFFEHFYRRMIRQSDGGASNCTGINCFYNLVGDFDHLPAPPPADDYAKVKLNHLARELSGFWMRGAALAVYMPNDRLHAPMANLRLPPLRAERTPSSQPSPMWWLEERSENAISSLINKFDGLCRTYDKAQDARALEMAGTVSGAQRHPTAPPTLQITESAR